MRAYRSFQILYSLLESITIRKALSWAVLVAGVSLYVLVQNYLITAPLTLRNQLPEVDDSLAYLARTQVAKECPNGDCPALESLRAQFNSMPADPEIQRQSEIAGFALPMYHPLFSKILIFCDWRNNDLITTYKMLWKLSPLLLGLAIACLLASIWGRSTAGIVLILVAFKVFPANGLHYFTPTILILTFSMILWARIILKKGYAPFSLLVGSVVLSAMHPVGIIFSLIAVIISLLIANRNNRKKLLIFLLLLGLFCTVLLLSTPVAEQAQIYNSVNPLRLFTDRYVLFTNIKNNILEAGTQLIRFKETLFGPLYILLPAAFFGFLYLDKERRRIAAIVLVTLFLALLGSLLHSHALTPNGSLFFRLFIPFLLVITGAPVSLFLNAARNLAVKTAPAEKQSSARFPEMTKLTGILVIAVLVAYGVETLIAGIIQIQITREYMTKRQPLSFSREQPRILLSEAGTGDCVLYGSTMIMASYFIQGCMKLGALYYHPAFSQSRKSSDFLQTKTLRYAAVYNPGVYHPSYAGLDEKERCITSPELTSTPLSKPRRSGPINQEGGNPRTPVSLAGPSCLRCHWSNRNWIFTYLIREKKRHSSFTLCSMVIKRPKSPLRPGALPRGGVGGFPFPSVNTPRPDPFASSCRLGTPGSQ